MLATAVPVTAWSLQRAAPSTSPWEGPQLLRLHVQRKLSEITRCPISHRSLMTESLMVQKFTSSGTEVTTVYLYHERVAPNLYLKIFFFFIIYFFLSFNWNLFTDLNFLLLISSAWLMHEGKGPKMALCHRWSAGDLLSFPCELASGCPPLDLAPSFSFGCSSPRGAVPRPGITQ